MAVNRKFVVKHGLDANSISIDNLGAAGSTFSLSGGHSLTFTTTGATAITLPTSGTLLTTTSTGSTSITTLGTVTTGTWNASIIAPQYGGTGVNNATRTLTLNTNNLTIDSQVGARTITTASNITVSGATTNGRTLTFATGDADRTVTLANNLTTSGNFALTLTTTGTTNVTLPTTGTLATLAGTETFTNKTLTSPAISGGTINNNVIGGTTPAAGTFTTLTSTGVFTANGGFKTSSASLNYPTYMLNLDWASDAANTWRRVFSATLGNQTFSTLGLIIEIEDPQSNHATVASVDNIRRATYYVALVRTEATTLDSPDTCHVRGPSNHVRAVKTAVGTYEVQIQNLAANRECAVKIWVYAVNGSHTYSFHDGDTAATGIAQYTASVSTTAYEWFQNIQVAGQIETNDADTAALPGYTWVGDTNTGIFRPTADVVGFSTAGTERMRVDASGNVVIGSTSTTQKLEVYGGAAGTVTNVQIGNASTALQVGVDSSNSAQIRTAQNVPMLFYTNALERLRIDGSGNVNIGTLTSNIARKFTVVGEGNFSDASNNTRLYMGYGTIPTTGGTGAYIYNADNSPLVFGTNNGERLRFDAAGAIGLSGANYGTAGQALVTSGAGVAPAWTTLTLANLPGAFVKMAVRAATTANITLSGTQTIDGVAVVANDRVLVKNQSTASQNGIYLASAGAWTRATDADTASDIAGALLAVDEGTTNKGRLFTNLFGSTDTLGTTSMPWYEVADTSSTQTFTNKTLTSPTLSSPTLNGTVTVAGGLMRTWSATDTDIDGLITGSTTGTLFEGSNSAHFTVGLRSNDVGDGFQVISKGAATTPATDPYTTLAFEVKANGNITWAGTATGNGSGITALNASNLTSGTVPNAQISQASVTQHQAALSIAETQIADGAIFPRLNANETVTGGWTFTATQTISNAAPGIALEETDQGVDLKRWLLVADGGNFQVQTRTDASAFVATPFQVSRAGVATFTGAVNIPLVPTADTHAASKQYVDNIATGLDFKQSVRAATTANITLSGAQTIDGVSVVAGDRVLVKDQTTGSQNGIYVVAAGAWARSTDADNSPAGEVTAGMYVFVEAGTTNGDSGWVLATDNPITLGTTALSFVQFTGIGQLNAGAGLTKIGNTVDVGTASTARIVVNAENIDLATVTDAGGGSFLKFTRDSYGRVSGTSSVVAGDITTLVDGTYVNVSGDTMTGSLVINVGGGTNSATQNLQVINGSSYGVNIVPRATAGAYNPLTAAGDAVIYASSAGTADGTGGLVIGLWSNSAKGIKIDSTGIVGIGRTPTAGFNLDVQGVGRATTSWRTNDGTIDGTFGVGQITAGTVGIGSVSNHNLVLGTNSTERMRIDTSGNIGIGAITPGTWSASAKVFEYAYPTMGMDSTGQLFLSFNLREGTSGVWTYKSTDTGNVLRTTAGGWVFSTAASGTINTTATLTERFRIALNGDVTTGGANLRVNGSSRLLIQDDGSNSYIRPTGGGTLFLGSTATNVVSITTTGATVTGTLASTGALFSNASVSAQNGTQGSIQLIPGGASNTGYVQFMAHTSGTRQGYIGFGSTNTTIDTGDIRYVAGSHSFTGSVNTSGGALGGTAGNTITLQDLTGSTSNGSTLRTMMLRETTGADWTTASTRLQHRTDSTWQAWMQFNGTNANAGISWGSGANATLTSVAERMRLDSNGILRLLTGTASTTSATGTLVVTGGVGVSGQVTAATVRAEAAATQDAVLLQGRAGGTGSFAVTLQPTTLTASRTLTLPDATGTVALTSQIPTVNNGTLTLAVSGTGLSGSASFTANQSGNSTFTVTLDSSSAFGAGNGNKVVLRDANGHLVEGATIDGGVKVGYRSIPKNAQTVSYTAAATDVGKCISTTAGVTINGSVFSAGDAITIYNDSASSITITKGTITNLRLAGSTSDGNRTLAARGMCTIWFNSATEAIASGAGLT